MVKYWKLIGVVLAVAVLAGVMVAAMPLASAMRTTSPFEGVWEGVNQGGVDCLFIERETGDVFSIKYYDPLIFGCGPGGSGGARVGIGSGNFQSELQRLRWYVELWCVEDPVIPSFGLCDGFMHDAIDDTLTCGSWGTWDRSKAKWHNIIAR